MLFRSLGLRPKRVDVAVVLDDLNVRYRTDLRWRESVVDLMKLLGLDASRENRYALADELGYFSQPGHSGKFIDNAEMNEWLRREIMKRVAENGGEVPEELRYENA